MSEKQEMTSVGNKNSKQRRGGAKWQNDKKEIWGKKKKWEHCSFLKMYTKQVIRGRMNLIYWEESQTRVWNKDQSHKIILTDS